MINKNETVVICEKPSQARNIRAAIGDNYGRIVAAQGHLLRLEMPEEINPAWRRWNYDILVPENRRFDYRPSDGGGKEARLREIESALRQAKSVIIATDCDREGEGIGRELLLYYKFEGEILRAMFSAEDKKTLTKAFNNLKPAAEYDRLYEAFYARAAVDKACNLTLTRVVTVRFKKPGAKGAIGVGRVMSPTLAIVCRRQKEIEAFEIRPFYEITMNLTGERGKVAVHYRPKGAGRIYEESEARSLVAAAETWQGPLSVICEEKKAAPPKFFDLPTLQKEAGKKGFSASRTLEIAQSLYEKHKIITYPRAAVRSLPEVMIDEVQNLLDQVKTIPAFSAIPLEKPIIRKGRPGYFSDKALEGESHHALIPNLAVAEHFPVLYSRLDADHKALFDIITRSFLEAVADDHVFDQTTMTAEVSVADKKYSFSEIGKITRTPGWTDLFPKEVAPQKGKKVEKEVILAPIDNGDPMTSEGAKSALKKTTPPKPYGEGELINAMQNAWKFVENEEEKERLKMAKGIGTPATRDQIIENLKQKCFEIKRKKIYATNYGMRLYELLEANLPELVDPGATARMELFLDSIQLGQNTADDVFEQAIERLRNMVDQIQNSYRSTELTKNHPPSDKMIGFARRIAAEKKIPLPPAALTDFAVCRLFIDNNVEPAPEDGSPSERQLGFARTLSEQTAEPIPEGALGSAEILGQWIDRVKSKAPPRMASEKQMVWVIKMVEEGMAAPDGYPDKVTAAAASAFLDKAFNRNQPNGG
ncbi:DNA topoisomerase [Paremcibacter congregatus]|uniref:DNA topoisomerase n=1 Tax=Paremcibacter congregatus TaxID=2043170 RepID=UPI0030ED5F77|tara:strand:- start:1549 stop:3834 length:2286 start_codon:yes stop_codon:yes gene_type:complete